MSKYFTGRHKKEMDLDAETDPKHSDLQTQSSLQNQINAMQTCWNTALMLHSKSKGGEGEIFDADGKTKKKLYYFPKGHCVLYTAYHAQQQPYSCCARVSSDQPASPTIELQPVLVQHVLVASC